MITLASDLWRRMQTELPPYTLDTRQPEERVEQELDLRNARNMLHWRIRHAVHVYATTYGDRHVCP